MESTLLFGTTTPSWSFIRVSPITWIHLKELHNVWGQQSMQERLDITNGWLKGRTFQNKLIMTIRQGVSLFSCEDYRKPEDSKLQWCLGFVFFPYKKGVFNSGKIWYTCRLPVIIPNSFRQIKCIYFF